MRPLPFFFLAVCQPCVLLSPRATPCHLPSPNPEAPLMVAHSAAVTAWGLLHLQLCTSWGESPAPESSPGAFGTRDAGVAPASARTKTTVLHPQHQAQHRLWPHALVENPHQFSTAAECCWFPGPDPCGAGTRTVSPHVGCPEDKRSPGSLSKELGADPAEAPEQLLGLTLPVQPKHHLMRGAGPCLPARQSLHTSPGSSVSSQHKPEPGSGDGIPRLQPLL